MAQSIPTARIPPPPPPPGHLSGVCLKKEKKSVAKIYDPWWGQHIYTNARGGASERGQIPDRPMGQDQKLYLPGLKQKNILIVFSGFS